MRLLAQVSARRGIETQSLEENLNQKRLGLSAEEVSPAAPKETQRRSFLFFTLLLNKVLTDAPHHTEAISERRMIRQVLRSRNGSLTQAAQSPLRVDTGAVQLEKLN